MKNRMYGILLCFVLAPPLRAQPFFLQSSVSLCDPVEAIERARVMLQDVSLDHSPETSRYYQVFRLPGGREEVRWAGTKKHLSYEYVKREIPLVLLNTFTCELKQLTIVRRIVRGGFVLDDQSADFDVGIEDRMYGRIWNGFNTPYEVSPAEWVVIGNLWAVYGAKDEYVFYVPFSERLTERFPVLFLLGREHLERDLLDAVADLRSRKIMSRAEPGRLVADVAEERFLWDMRHILQMEHADIQEFMAYRDGAIVRDPLLRGLFILGANGDTAFNATRSGARAEGIYQLWPPTCAAIREKKYPGAGVPPGCRSRIGVAGHSHIEAAKTVILLFDNNTREVIDVFGEDALRNPDLRWWRVAMYNGGSFRLFCELSKKNQCPRESRMRPETRMYLEKYDFLRAREELLPLVCVR